ncbi:MULTISPECIES: TIGR02530 family flagellar biosynthesis protein [Agathobacter]|uniref:Flagellar protein n=1 Tax=Agathobacter ruminis TaxID=1712665 RepID=A0A2G3E3E6_9FIRM|nr:MULTISPECIES: TIGR02530 family flagellar biosynthesis protein [Agathobacter]MBQ1682234.1 flagellar protein [Agathobacter sp.]MDC7302638.1 flagellar protein [Agathobacter ruminis]PHU37802.1 flagellar protein [Agathobacter ruminis]
MNKIAGQFTSIEQISDQYLSKKGVNNSSVASDISFESVLKQQLFGIDSEPVSSIKFSKHALSRLDERNITLTEEQSVRLEDGVNQADEKGIKDSLVLVDSLAFIVNVPNRTVVTAMDQTDTENNIFTNIDGAVIN